MRLAHVKMIYERIQELISVNVKFSDMLNSINIGQRPTSLHQFHGLREPADSIEVDGRCTKYGRNGSHTSYRTSCSSKPDTKRYEFMFVPLSVDLASTLS